MFISQAVLNGRYVLRLAIGQMSTTEEDVRGHGTCSDGRQQRRT